MNLTTKQVAEKLGVMPNVVRNLVNTGKLKPANAIKPGLSKTLWEFDSKLVREFALTYVRVVRAPKQPKSVIVNVKTGETRPGGNGHAPTLPLDIPSSVQLFNYLTATRVELGTRLGIIEEKLAKLMAVWGVE